jgi:4-diphosphocytidyl-2-C-methyl-D-erythritol kinase
VRLRALAPGKVNLCLFLGGLRDDGRHELVTLLESVSLADEVEMITRPALDDVVVCPDVEGPNIVADALQGLRDRGWKAPRVKVTIRKRIPIAAGMGGGSADAAAVLRMAQRLAPVPLGAVAELAKELGSDVPSQLEPGLVIGTGVGDQLEHRAPLQSHAYTILPSPRRLATAEVYTEADRLALPRPDLADCRRALGRAVAPGARLPDPLLVNDLEPAARSLCPELAQTLQTARDAGAEDVFVCGSGPTIAGIFWGPDANVRAATAAASLAARFPGAAAAVPVAADFGFPLFA